MCLAARENHVTLIQRPHPPPSFHSPPHNPPPAQRGGAEVSKLSGNYVASRIGKCLFIYLPILMIYHVASFGDDLLSVT